MAAARALRAGRGADRAEAPRRPRGGRRPHRVRRTRRLEIERGLRMRLAPQGITGTSYLEIDYVDPPPPIAADRLEARQHVHPRARRRRSTRSSTAAIDIMDRLHKLDIEETLANLNTLLVTTNDRVAAIDTKALSQRADRVLAKIETTLDNIDSEEAFRRGASRCSPSCATTQRRAQEDARQPGAAEAARRHRRRRSRASAAIVDDPNARRSRSRACRARSPGSTGSWAAARPTSPSRSRTCARSPTTCAT